ncbi:chloride channel protein [Corynebacterium sp. ES2794-CONJ1]|uniref:chloride channel protein n=1 Tax=unclassified Corynebacterium TaxID=2624378 RepID=UPI0021678254|nr:MULTISPECIES: chloride channel protein [unclassified Corynebacterium]MCS4489905.1 chloride channel protein [Corynebacterium sp. ES2775-CONJ]MCS4491732.1 chloride channel protein [Corynebacterium sp. ES2715-CONJ3]MCS4531837.1 chloride channel protein [Corynebacterium sp. ES2730-CONJ]MCU9519233.1 chloride channel protein [Corynebacterium sp. ES2794-CONJ1]
MFSLLLSALFFGVTAGLVGAATSLLIENIACLNPILLLPAGVVAAGAWLMISRRWSISVASAITTGGPLPVVPTLIDATMQLLLVGLGASLGREQAPRQVAAALSSRMDRVVIAGAAGGGLAAVYNVPLAGALYAFLLLPITRTVRNFLVCALMAGVATLTSWLVLDVGTIYSVTESPISTEDLGAYLFTALMAMTLGLLLRELGSRSLRATSSITLLSIPLACATVWITATYIPPVTGNGQLIVEQALLGLDPTYALILIIAKLALTLAMLSSGARGGVLTPALALGAAGGAMTASLWNTSPVALALFGAFCALAISQQSWIFAAIFVLELSRPSLALSAVITLSALTVVTVGTFAKKRYARPPRSATPPDRSS